MKANPEFQNLDKSFWAHVRLLSQSLGYTSRQTQQIRIYTIEDILKAMSLLQLESAHLVPAENVLTPLANQLLSYFEHRAATLNRYVEPRLMNADRASKVFGQIRQELNSEVFVPMNKQSGDKKAPAYFTGIITMIIEAHLEGLPCVYDPRRLTTIVRNGMPLRTLARRVDGCFPSEINPLAIWEIKEYYYTTTFGSRVADGVYESLLDGLELEELWEHEKIDVQHLLFVDSHYTWWIQGRSYLCRLIDMLHMGYVDEILFGYEVVEQLPEIVSIWVDKYKSI